MSQLSQTEGCLDKPIPILYQDENIIAVDKPGGLLVHRSKESRDTVFLLQTLSQQTGLYLYPVHRLDRATSGVIVFALSKEDAVLLQQSLQDSSTMKQYITLVRRSTEDYFVMDCPLKDENGVKKSAKTTFRKITELFRCSLLFAELHSGRRHQIRRHLDHLAHQIIGDTTYGKGKINRFFREEYNLPRMFLHATRLCFRHPRSGNNLEIHAPLATDLREFILGLPECDPGIIAEL